MTWQRITTSDPIFRRSTRRRDGLRIVQINGEFMRVRRYISPTEAWVERATSEESWRHMMADAATPFMRHLRRGTPASTGSEA